MKKRLQLFIEVQCGSKFQYDFALSTLKAMSLSFHKFFLGKHKENHATSVITFPDERREVING